jgi:methyl-accepting chemotaxis protein
MGETSAEHTSSIGIVGGGKAGLELLELFKQYPKCRVAYVVDLDASAPAVKKAKQEGIPTFVNCQEAASKVKADIIFEVTGSTKVADDLLEICTTNGAQLVTHEAAFLTLSAIEENTHLVQAQVVDEIVAIKSEIVQSLQQVNEMVDGIRNITAEMRMLALNAQIEAARAGEHGRGFGVVAQYMSSSVNSVRDISDQIEGFNKTIQSVADRIDSALEKLN